MQIGNRTNRDKVDENGPKLDKKLQIGFNWKTESFLEHFPNRYFGPVVVLTLQKHRVHIFAENMLQMAVTIMDQVWGNHLGKSSFLNSYEVVNTRLSPHLFK